MILKIENEVYQKVMHWVNKADFEVSGFGVIEIEDGVPVVKDAILLDQVGSSAETEIDPNDINKAEYMLRDHPGEMRWWWHSHVNMAVFWSGTDQATIAQLGSQGWFFHTVFNKKNEYRTAFSCPNKLETPFEAVSPVYFKDEIETEFIELIDEEKIAIWDKSYDEKVREKKFSPWPEWHGSEGYEHLPSYNQKQLGLFPKKNRDDVYEIIKSEVEDLMDQGLTDADIMDSMGDEIRSAGVNLRETRQDFLRLYGQ